jgi:large subunit ribosomal protein L2
MGKRIIAQRRGKGSHTFKAPSHRYLTKLKYRQFKDDTEGKIIDIVNDPARNAPLALIEFPDKSRDFILVPEGIKTGDIIKYKKEGETKRGDVLILKNIQEGTPIFNIELTPGDGGKVVRSSGVFATVISHDKKKTIIKLPSKRFKTFNSNCRASIGIVAGGERKTKPFVKAGKKWHVMHARGKMYPRSSANAMNVVDHKFGGQSFGVKKTVSRNAPPGRKVGSIAAKRTGKKK